MKNIRSLSKEELLKLMRDQGQPAYRAGQVYEWLWQKGARSFDDMSNLSKELRTWLSEQFIFSPVSVDVIQKSSDETLKARFVLHDGKLAEGVLIPAKERSTACVSSQVGCSLGCKFCATGYMGRGRNLDKDEIFDQVVLLNRLSQEHYGKKLTNIVFMGMGEPLLNYRNVMAAIGVIGSPDGLGMSPRRVTVSTAGLAKQICRLGDDKVRFKLAVSLHAATDEKRNRIMPVNRENPLEELSDALKYYHGKTGGFITFEYALLDGFNDTEEDAKALAAFCKDIPCKVNLIEYNPIREARFRSPSGEKINAFAIHLVKRRIMASVRRSRGKDIDAACGQLANK